MTGIINNDHIRELCNNLVLAVEQDVKQRLITRWQAEQQFQTGMHGEPLEPVARRRGERGKDRKPWRQGSKIHKLFRALATRKHGLNIKSLARESGMTEKSVHQAIKTLRGQGYKIQCDRVGYSRPKYKLAS
jgi:biotin operon repressor